MAAKRKNDAANPADVTGEFTEESENTNEEEITAEDPNALSANSVSEEESSSKPNAQDATPDAENADEVSSASVTEQSTEQSIVEEPETAPTLEVAPEVVESAQEPLLAIVPEHKPVPEPSFAPVLSDEEKARRDIAMQNWFFNNQVASPAFMESERKRIYGE